MAIGENEISDDDIMTDISLVTEVESESESDDENADQIGIENINWTEHLPPDVMYEHPQFTGPARGPLKPVNTYLQCIKLYLTPNVIDLVVTETNRVIQSKGPKRNRKGETINRKLLTASELWVYIAVAMLGEMHNKSVSRDNWSTDKLLYTPIFGQVMTRDRYEEIGKHLHFVDNTITPPSGDKFGKYVIYLIYSMKPSNRNSILIEL